MTNDMPDRPSPRPAATRRIPLAIGAVLIGAVIGFAGVYEIGGPDFEVVAINIDTRDPEKPKNFLKDANLTRLGYFSDQKAKVFQDLKAIGRALGMPTSVLVDGQGCEIATIAGPAEWGSDDAVKLITAAMKPPG